MKRLTSFIMIILVLLANGAAMNIFAQDSVPAGTPLSNPLASSRESGETNPQFALSLLDEYFRGNEAAKRKTGAVLTAVGGGLFVLGAAGAGYAFLTPSTSFQSPEEQMIIRGVTAGVTGIGGLIGGIGLIALTQPKEKYKTEYSSLYAETDPVVQEALAYGIMKDIADDAKRTRITGGIIGVATPLAVLGTQAIIASATGDWDSFTNNSVSSLRWTLPNLVSGIVMLIGGTTKEERLLETYRATSSAYSVKKK